MTMPSVSRREQGRCRRVPREAQKAERSLRRATINAKGVKDNGEQLLASFACERLDAMVIQDAQIWQDTVLNRCKFSRDAVKAHIVRSGDRFHSQLIMVRQELEASVRECAEIDWSKPAKKIPDPAEVPKALPGNDGSPGSFGRVE